MAASETGGRQWGGRFRQPLDDRALAYSESISFDWRLYPYDLAGSTAHARMLGAQGIIPAKSARALIQGLKQVGQEIVAGTFDFRTELEDIHTNVEARLRDICGAEIAGQLHTARSRNDQVATDLRLYLMDELPRTSALLRNLQGALLDQAKANADLIMPGLTHLQHAQPVSVAHHLLAYVDMFDRDRLRIERAAVEVRRLPLGAGALAGTTFPIDQRAVADELGFPDVIPNSLAAVSDRDFVVEVVNAAALIMMHLSRFSEELVLWSSTGYGYIELSDAFTTGSSMMPQKKNPDMAELARGKTGRVYGALMALLTMLKGLPLSYNRDMQEDKRALFEALDITHATLGVFAPMVRDMTWLPEALQAACAQGFLGATDVADYLVEKGMAFRDAHAVVGVLVTTCLDQGKTLEDFDLETLQRFSSKFDDDAVGRFTIPAVVEARQSDGGTASARVRAALRKARRTLQRAGGVGDVPPAQWQAGTGPR